MNNYVKENEGYLTYSKLKLVDKDPEAFDLKYNKGMDMGDNDKVEFRIGRAFDEWCSMGDAEWGLNYLIKEKNARGKADGFIDVFTYTEGNALRWCMDEAKRQPLFMDCLKKMKHQQVLTGNYELDGQRIPIKGTLDMVDFENHVIMDTKTTASNLEHIGNPYKCPIINFEYLMQAAFYSLLYKVKIGVFPKFYFNFFSKGYSKKQYSQFLQVEIPFELLSPYYPHTVQGQSNDGRIVQIIKKWAYYENNGYPKKNNLPIGHLGTEYYPLQDGSLQKEPYVYQGETLTE